MDNRKNKRMFRIFGCIAIIVVEIILIPVAAYLGMSIDAGIADPNAIGHPVPIFTALFVMLAMIVFLITIVVMVIVAIVQAVRRSKKKQESLTKNEMNN